MGLKSRDLEWGVARHTPYPRIEVRIDAETLGNIYVILHFRTFCSSTPLTVRRVAPRVITSNISSFLAGSTTISAQIRNPGEISLKSVYKPFYILYMVIYIYYTWHTIYMYIWGDILRTYNLYNFWYKPNFDPRWIDWWGSQSPQSSWRGRIWTKQASICKSTHYFDPTL